MELRQLRYFVAIAEEGGFSRAAQRLHISQPPLSMQLRALEDELGVQLLRRSNRGVTLTAAGEAFYTEVRGLLAKLDLATQRARELEHGDAGTLSIGFVSIAGYGVLPPALKSFRARFPKVDVQLHELTTDAQIRELRAGKLDLGIGLAPVEESDLEFSTLLREALVLAAPADHAEGKTAAPIDLRRLARESFIVPPRDIAPGLYDLAVGLCRSSGFTPRITQHARQMQTVIGLVASGMGFALVPASVQSLKRKGVRYRPLLGRAARIEIGLLSQRGASSALRDNFALALRSAAAAQDR